MGKKNNFKAFVIGGAGFIGSHLVETLLDDGRKVVVYDNFSKGKRSFLSNHSSLKIIEGDILDVRCLKEAINFERPDTVFHLAAIHYIPTCEQMPDQAIRVNIEGTQNVLTACRNKVNKIVFTSTGAVYDPDTHGALNESSDIKAGDIYGITKVAGEELLEYHVQKGYGAVVIARLFNAVGLNETNLHLIPVIMKQLAEGAQDIRLGNLYPKRDYIHVKDIVDALICLEGLESNINERIFNVGLGVEFSVQELVGLVEQIIGKKITVLQDINKIRKNDRYTQLADIGRITSLTDWKPQRTLSQALSEIWNKM